LAKKSHTENTVGPWAAQKLDALKNYLEFYTTALKNAGYWEKVYIDAFAGSGVSRIRTEGQSNFELATLFDLDEVDIAEAEQYIKGSPAIALELNTPFDKYYFVERDESRAVELRGKYGQRTDIEIRSQDASEALLDISTNTIKKRCHRAVAFVDPYGLNISWSSINALGKTGATEVIINFAWAMAINRLMVKEGKIPDRWRAMLDNFFGDSDWYDLVYSVEPDLFGGSTSKADDAEKKILNYYVAKLKGAFGNVAPPMLVRNTKGNPLYYLIWAGPHKLGLKGAAHVLSQGETVLLA
jgi:three-Cys-motif partner protein